MPYIIQDKRDVLDPQIEELLNGLRELESDDPSNSMAGNLNYIFTKLLIAVSSKKYDDINEAVGVLECCKLELYRRFAAPYENQKAHDNGDVYEDTV